MSNPKGMVKFLLSVMMIVVTFFTGWAIAEAHDWYPDDGCRPGTSNDGFFYAAGPASSWVVDTSSGWNGCHMRTTNTQVAKINWGEWYLPISTAYNHLYGLNAYVQSDGTTLTSNAHYRVWANGHGAGITADRYLNQSANQGGFCYNLGPAQMNGSNGGLVDLIDVTGEPTGTTWVYFDLFCYVTIA